MMFDDILTLLKAVLGARDRLDSAKQDVRDRAADYLDGVSSELSRFTSSFRGSANPGDDRSMNDASFEALRHHMGELFQLTRQAVGEKLAGELAEDLRNAHQLPTTLRYDVFRIQGDEDREERLRQIDVVAGKFRATSASLRARR